MSVNPVPDTSDTFRFYSDCGVCHTSGFFRRKHKHTLPNGVTVFSRSFMCRDCRKNVEKQLSDSEKRVIQ